MWTIEVLTTIVASFRLGRNNKLMKITIEYEEEIGTRFQKVRVAPKEEYTSDKLENFEWMHINAPAG